MPCTLARCRRKHWDIFRWKSLLKSLSLLAHWELRSYMFLRPICTFIMQGKGRCSMKGSLLVRFYETNHSPCCSETTSHPEFTTDRGSTHAILPLAFPTSLNIHHVKMIDSRIEHLINKLEYLLGYSDNWKTRVSLAPLRGLLE